MDEPKITEIGGGTYFVEGGAVNWVLVADGDALTLIDSGYPGDYPAVKASVERIGHRLEQIEAVLITHAHVDHVGALPRVLKHAEAPVYLTATEAGHARGEFQEQATPVGVALNSWRPGFLRWSLHAARAGALQRVRIPTAQPFPCGPLEVPGRPVPVSTPGHTSGHCVYVLPGARAAVTGDTLVTGHPTSQLDGPQLLMSLFSHDQDGVLAALDTLEELDADVILPGHGPVHHGSLREAAALARTRASAA